MWEYDSFTRPLADFVCSTLSPGPSSSRGGEIVFGVNDFDEAAIYDFQLDVIRIAVSIVNHGKSNGLNDDEIESALEALTYSTFSLYVACSFIPH